MDACEAEVTWDEDAEDPCEEEAWEEEAWEEEAWEEEACEDAANEAWDADEDWIEADEDWTEADEDWIEVDAAWDEEATWLKTELLCAADAKLVEALLTTTLLPRTRTWLVDDTVVAAAWDEEDCEPELTETLPMDPEALGLVFEDPSTFADELLDAACDPTTDRLAVEVVGFTPATPAWPLVRVATGFVLVDDEEDWALADDAEDWTLADDEVDWLLANDEATDAAPVALDDETTEEDLTPGTPLVRVTTGDTDPEVETVELDCTTETLEEELATFDDELFRAEEEAWPRVAVTEGLVLELLALEDDFLLEVLESFVEDFDEDFAEAEVALTDDALVLVAVLKMHLHALDTWDADRPGIGELVLVSAAHHLQKGVVWVISSCTAAISLLTQTSFVLVVLLVVTALFETFADVETIFAPLTAAWLDVLLVEVWATTHLQTLVRELAARSGRGDVLRLMTSQNWQNAAPYLTSPLKVLRSVAEQAGDVSNLTVVMW
jgi:hypothetical protein